MLWIWNDSNLQSYLGSAILKVKWCPSFFQVVKPIYRLITSHIIKRTLFTITGTHMHAQSHKHVHDYLKLMRNSNECCSITGIKWNLINFSSSETEHSQLNLFLRGWKHTMKVKAEPSHRHTSFLTGQKFKAQPTYIRVENKTPIRNTNSKFQQKMRRHVHREERKTHTRIHTHARTQGPNSDKGRTSGCVEEKKQRNDPKVQDEEQQTGSWACSRSLLPWQA